MSQLPPAASSSSFRWPCEFGLGEQAESMFGITKKDDSGAGRDSMIGRPNLDGAIELGLEKGTLVFTHRVFLAAFELVVANREAHWFTRWFLNS